MIDEYPAYGYRRRMHTTDCVGILRISSGYREDVGMSKVVDTERLRAQSLLSLSSDNHNPLCVHVRS